MRVTPPSIPRAAELMLRSPVLSRRHLVVLTGLGLQFALHSCLQSGLMTIILSESVFVKGAIKDSISPNPAVPSLSLSDSASQPLSSTWHSSTPSILSFSWLLRTSLVLWVLLLLSFWAAFRECYVLTPPQGWTLSIPALLTGFHWAIFSALHFLSIPGSIPSTLHTQLSQASFSNLIFPLDSRLVYSTPYWTGSFWIFDYFLFWIFCSQSFSSFLDFTYQWINRMSGYLVGCHLGTKVLAKGYGEI